MQKFLMRRFPNQKSKIVKEIELMKGEISLQIQCKNQQRKNNEWNVQILTKITDSRERNTAIKDQATFQYEIFEKRNKFQTYINQITFNAKQSTEKQGRKKNKCCTPPCHESSQKLKNLSGAMKILIMKMQTGLGTQRNPTKIYRNKHMDIAIVDDAFENSCAEIYW